MLYILYMYIITCILLHYMQCHTKINALYNICLYMYVCTCIYMYVYILSYLYACMCCTTLYIYYSIQVCVRRGRASERVGGAQGWRECSWGQTSGIYTNKVCVWVTCDMYCVEYMRVCLPAWYILRYYIVLSSMCPWCVQCARIRVIL